MNDNSKSLFALAFSCMGMLKSRKYPAHLLSLKCIENIRFDGGDNFFPFE
jgi:hypothetical protein